MHFSPALSLFISFLLFLTTPISARFVMYYDEWHLSRPSDSSARTGIDHVVMAFAPSTSPASYTPKVPISIIKSEFGANTKVMIAIGGWGDTAGFSTAAATTDTRGSFAQAVAQMLASTGADGVDIDWEYPGGDGADYKITPNTAKTSEIETYPLLLAAIRSAIGPDKLLSIAVPGLARDMIAFTATTGPQIWPSVDYINVMSYDLMNRRDNVTKHHTSVQGSLDTINNYLSIGAPASKINLGFAYYAKWFTTTGDCSASPLGCATAVLEDPVSGDDTGLSGAYTFETANMEAADTSQLTTSPDGTCGAGTNYKCTSGTCCGQYGYCGTDAAHCASGCQFAYSTACTGSDVAGSWVTAQKNAMLDSVQGGEYYWDASQKLFWSWDTPDLMAEKFAKIVQAKGLGGVMAWSLGEDSYDWSHIKAMAVGLAGCSGPTTTSYATPSPTASPTTSTYPSTTPNTTPSDTSNVAPTTTTAGRCAPDGSIQCNGESAFSMCVQGGWVNMGSVAAGTKCVGGTIVGM
ncbi:carbohydrate-binding module family 18 protein [Lepidopterella palustris CBS 459.81]|uniref:chitinase n=1 Tax=Lepidopterella palustris CBS 459.81 TaxID=1314670 RepID=A0A8E2EKC8_9PEZI|nr:carbohydrate-binding module family 18 protein [Lepidopterella palustris CBS 459.81]